MTKIVQKTTLQSSIEEVFDLNRNIDFHQYSASQTQEKAIAGRTSGLIELNEVVKWKGKHFGFWLTHTSKITEMNYPYFFTDEMIQGNFLFFKHQHYFQQEGDLVIQTDILEYKVPFGIIGKIFDFLFLKRYLKNFLEIRNQSIKKFTEK